MSPHVYTVKMHSHVVHQLITTASSITRRLDNSLSAVRGITYSEYQLLAAIEREPEAAASRVVLAQRVGLTPSGVTRALKPLEKLGYVETVKDGRDARRSIATLTPAGRELTSDAAGVVEDTLSGLNGVDEMPQAVEDQLVAVLEALSSL